MVRNTPGVWKRRSCSARSRHGRVVGLAHQPLDGAARHGDALPDSVVQTLSARRPRGFDVHTGDLFPQLLVTDQAGRRQPILGHQACVRGDLSAVFTTNQGEDE
jgi:hypothetical protein